ncbi:MAG: Antitoxin HipB [Gammaproteobacteria bacterium]|nr:Antitoxin HipB [Gammaproteobacteria bacterium]
MHYEFEYIAKTLKAARESKGLSQRELGKRAGVLQAQISKFENGAVDLRLSSLVALARVLDLELTLVPRKAVPAVQSIIKSSKRPSAGLSDEMRRARKELTHFQETIDRVTKLKPGIEELAQLQRYARDFQRFQSALPDPKTIQNASKVVQQFKKNTENLNKLRDTLAQFENWRSNLAHSSIDIEEVKPMRPAYSLDEEDDNG